MNYFRLLSYLYESYCILFVIHLEDAMKELYIHERMNKSRTKKSIIDYYPLNLKGYSEYYYTQ